MAAYDVFAVRPHVARFRSLLEHADPEDRNPPRLIRALIDADGNHPAEVARLLMLNVPGEHSSAAFWQTRAGLWRWLVPLHLEADETYGLHAALAYNGLDYGMNDHARRVFGKPLSRLSPEEAARVVAQTHFPTSGSDRVERRARLLLDSLTRGATGARRDAQAAGAAPPGS